MLKKILDIYNDCLVRLFLVKWFCVDYERFMKRNHNPKKLILRMSFITVFLTFLATIPTNVFISIPLAVLDLLQFQVFINLVQQCILYHYGQEDLRDSDGKIGFKNGDYLMWLQAEAMFGLRGSVNNKLKSAGSFIVRKSISLIFTKSPFRVVLMSLLRQFLKWCGVVVTHELLLSSLDILVVGLCALIAALVSLWQFLPMCKNFYKNIRNNGVSFYSTSFCNIHSPNS
ncbi:MAG: hypothetical protein II956_02640 [Bacteroidales bacterium]|nr:hypothetical protein [Bacteroidales bacterium]